MKLGKMKKMVSVIVFLALVLTTTISAFGQEELLLDPSNEEMLPESSAEEALFSVEDMDALTLLDELEKHPGVKPDHMPDDSLSNLGEGQSALEDDSVFIPASYVVPKDYLPKLRNQACYGTCWAHSTIASIESNTLKQGFAGYSRDNIDFSEFQLAASCDYSDKVDPLGGTTGDRNISSFTMRDNKGEFPDREGDPIIPIGEESTISDYLNNGGNSTMSMAALSSWCAGSGEYVAPYTETGWEEYRDRINEYSKWFNDNCKDFYDLQEKRTISKNMQNALYTHLYNTKVYAFNDAYIGYIAPKAVRLKSAQSISRFASQKDINKAKSLIMQNGAAQICYYATDEDKTVSDMPFINEGEYAYFCPVSKGINHSVGVVGWDDNYDKSNFNNSELIQNNGAWLIRNSWETDPVLQEDEYPKYTDGEGSSIEVVGTTDNKGNYSGYFWISYEDKTISNFCSYEIMPVESYDQNYLYDGGSQLTSYGRKNEYTIASVFKSAPINDENETLEAINITTMSTNLDLTISIYEHLEGADPSTGHKVAPADTNVFLECMGNYTIELNQPLSLERGEVFAVVVTGKKAGDDVSFGIEYKEPGGYEVAIEPGQNFEYDSDNGWLDLAEYGDKTCGNLCLKAYAKDGIQEGAKDYNVVELDLNGGELVNPDDDTILYIENGQPYNFPSVKRDGYSFLGWYDQLEDGTKVNSTDISGTSYESLYAHWSKGKIAKPTYSASGTIKKGTRIALTANVPGAQIYYAITSGVAMMPGDTFKLYEEPVLIETNDCWLHAYAVKAGYEKSDSLLLRYTFADETTDWGDVELEDQALYNDATEVPNTLWVAGVDAEVSYRGKAITYPDLRVYYHKKLLKQGTDYVTKYASNVNAGTAKITITGKGNYTGTAVKTFDIKPLSLGYGVISQVNAPDITVVTAKKAQKGTTTVTYIVEGATVVLKSGKDFTYQYDPAADYKTPGDYTITINGRGNYTGTATFTETIVEAAGAKLISKVKAGKIGSEEATGSQITPAVVLTDGTYPLEKDTDYTVSYGPNRIAGTGYIYITGTGNYKGSMTLTFKITSRPMSKVTVTGIENKTFDGSPLKQNAYVLTYKPSKKAAAESLVEGVDFYVDSGDGYENNVNAGNKATIIFTGMGKYSGELRRYYTISPYALEDTNVTLKDAGGEVKYKKNGATADIEVKVGETVLRNGTDYTVKYTNNKAINDGSVARTMPTATIKGIGNYSGTFTRTFTIVGRNLNLCSFSAADVAYAQKAGVCKPALTLTDVDGGKLVAGKDYDKTNIEYRYAQDVEVFHIDKKKNVSTERKYDGELVDLKTDIIPAGTEINVTVHGINNYSGSTTAMFRIVATDISKAAVAVNSLNFTGYEQTLLKRDLTITIGKKPNIVTLTSSDYEIVGYTMNLNSGKASVTIHGIGNYGGTKTVYFKILPRAIN